MKNEIALNESLTMSSQDIASLVDSRHDKVKQSIERLAAKGVIQLTPMGGGLRIARVSRFPFTTSASEIVT